jgi:hypothetical protein
LFSDRKGKGVVKFEAGVILSVREWAFSVGLPVKFSVSLSLLLWAWYCRNASWFVLQHNEGSYCMQPFWSNMKCVITIKPQLQGTFNYHACIIIQILLLSSIYMITETQYNGHQKSLNFKALSF